MVHGGMVYAERAEMAAVSCGTSHASGEYSEMRYKKLVTHTESSASAVCLLKSRE